MGALITILMALTFQVAPVKMCDTVDLDTGRIVSAPCVTEAGPEPRVGFEWPPEHQDRKRRRLVKDVV